MMRIAETSSLDPDDWKSVLRFFAWTMLLPLLLVVDRETVGDHTVLLRPVPQWVSMVSYASGLLVGLLLARKFWVIRNAVPQSTAKVAFVSIIMIPLAVVTATYLDTRNNRGFGAVIGRVAGIAARATT